MFAEALRKDLSQRAATYARKHNLGVKTSKSGVVIFQTDDNERTHGNFFTPSYKSIINHTGWRGRLSKTHASAVTAFSKADGIRELDSCMSSDALLMNVFCHPRLNQWKGLKRLFGVTAFDPQFGFKAGVKKNTRGDDTEIDMVLDGIFIESKLTEVDFQQKSASTVGSYDRFEDVFHKEILPQSSKGYMNYQLIRNVLATEQYGYRFYLVCDGRRPDLVREFYMTVRCVKDKGLRERLSVIFWQEIVQVVGNDLKAYLAEKYGLAAS